MNLSSDGRPQLGLLLWCSEQISIPLSLADVQVKYLARSRKDSQFIGDDTVQTAAHTEGRTISPKVIKYSQKKGSVRGINHFSLLYCTLYACRARYRITENTIRIGPTCSLGYVVTRINTF